MTSGCTEYLITLKLHLPPTSLVLNAQRFDHITPYLRGIHWLKFPERRQFRFGGLVFCCLYGTAPVYLDESLHLAADNDAIQCLRSPDALTLLVLATRLKTLGDRAFPV